MLIYYVIHLPVKSLGEPCGYVNAAPNDTNLITFLGSCVYPSNTVCIPDEKGVKRCAQQGMNILVYFSFIVEEQ